MLEKQRKSECMPFSLLADAYERIEGTQARLEIMGIMADVFAKANAGNIDKIIYLSQGLVAPPHEGLEVGLGEKFVEEAISLATGYPKRIVEEKYKKLGDLGLVAEALIKDKKQTSLFVEPLTVEKVYDNFLKIAKTGGKGSQEAKIKALVDLLNNATPKEARYITRFPIGRLRLGLGDATMIDALSAYHAGDKSLREEIERAYNITSDLGFVAKKFFEDPASIRGITVEPFKPIRPALAERLASAEEIIEKIGECAVEAKYDGFRCQVHKKGDVVEIFSRKLERTTSMFPEIVESARELKVESAIFEGEALAVNETTGEFYPFQMTIQRKRKYGVEEMAEEYPLKLFVFEILYLNGRDLTNEPYARRRKMIEENMHAGIIEPADMKIASSAKELEEYFESYIERGLEGIVAKDLNAPYVAGARKFAWIKLKRSYQGELADTVDVVIVGYYLGKGKRAQFGFGGLLGAVYDEEDGRFKTVAKIGSGFTEEQMVEFRRELDKIRVKEKPTEVDALITPDFWVIPKYVVSVSADEITRSPTHTCGRKENETKGYALRFPRIIGGIRMDKGPTDATTVGEIIRMHDMQSKKTVADSV
ncbi:MAG: ATP-dependent DNA ligase [Candidatus Micrarchaeia archaeon]